MTRPTTLLAGSALLLGAPAAAAAPGEPATPETVEELSRLSIEELARLTVRSASRRDEPLGAAATALYVVTGEEIEQTAAHSIPEALRLAPNLQVQQVDARQYAIAARGFNSAETSNKLLVLIDGRTVYSPLGSTVFWELHNRPVEEIRQIEMISGPGGTLYGPNAVNGVINILTRDAGETLGSLVRATAGGYERTLALRYGLPLGTDGGVRVYGQLFDREDLPPTAALDADDRFRGWQAGFRTDWGSGGDRFTLQGDLFDTDTSGSPLLRGDGDSGHNLLARWRRTSEDATLEVQAYYDRVEREFLKVRDRLQTFDVQIQYDRRSGSHDLVLGGGVRTTRDEFINNLNIFQLDPQSRRLWVFNIFAQDRIALSDRLSLILGLKAERTSFTGIELLPNVRLAWRPDDSTLLWAAASRAVRTPSRIDRQLVALPLLAPGDDFVSEKLIAFEAGYRGRPTPATTLSVSVFLNLYDDIRSTEFTGDPLPIRLRNGWSGRTYGLEAWGGAQLARWWRLNLGVVTLWKDFELDAGRIDLAAGDSLGHDPNFQLIARSQMDLSDRIAFNAGLRWVGDLEAASGPGLPAYVEADARLGWQVADALELYVAGRNLLHRTHAESDDPQRAQLIRRSLFAGTRVRF